MIPTRVATLALAATLVAACASPPAPDVAAVPTPERARAVDAPPQPAGVPPDAAVVPLAATGHGTRLFAVTRVHQGEHVDFLGIGASDGATRPLLRPDGDWRLFGRADPAFGSAVLSGPDGWAYAFGVRGDGGLQRAYLARFPEAAAGDRSAWRFRARDGRWVPSVREAAALFPAGPGGLAVLRHPEHAGVVAVYLRADRAGGASLWARACPAGPPSWGPWGPEVRLLHLPALPPPGRVAFDRAPRASGDGPRVVDVPGAGRFRIVPSAQRP